MVFEERLLSLLDQTPVDAELRVRILGQITRDFHAERRIEDRAADKQQPTASAVDDLEVIKARGRAEWLKLRRKAAVESKTSNRTQMLDSSKRGESERDSGKSLDDDTSEQ